MFAMLELGSDAARRAACASVGAALLAAACAVPAAAADPAEVTREEVRTWHEEQAGTEPSFEPGDVIGPDALARLRPFLPPGYLAEFDFDGMRVEIAPTGDYRPHPDYVEATKRFADETELGESGELFHYVAGQPFRNERIADAPPDEAGLMIGWNFNFRWQNYGHHVPRAWTALVRAGAEEDDDGGGGSGFEGELVQGGGQIDRAFGYSFQRVYHSHLSQLEGKDHTLDLREAEEIEYRDKTEFFAPYNLRDQRTIIERSNDPHGEDQAISYMPTERRVRRISAKERRDSWQGSELTFDDFYCFSGRVADYQWRRLGRQRVLAVMDAKPPAPVFGGPRSAVPVHRRELRDSWIVEQVPKDDGHPYGSKILFVDTQTYTCSVALIFDRDLRLWRRMSTVRTWSESPHSSAEEDRGLRLARYVGSAIIDYKSGYVTLSEMRSARYPEVSAAEVRRMFSSGSLQ